MCADCWWCQCVTLHVRLRFIGAILAGHCTAYNYWWRQRLHQLTKRWRHHIISRSTRRGGVPAWWGKTTTPSRWLRRRSRTTRRTADRRPQRTDVHASVVCRPRRSGTGSSTQHSANTVPTSSTSYGRPHWPRPRPLRTAGLSAGVLLYLRQCYCPVCVFEITHISTIKSLYLRSNGRSAYSDDRWKTAPLICSRPWRLLNLFTYLHNRKSRTLTLHDLEWPWTTVTHYVAQYRCVYVEVNWVR